MAFTTAWVMQIKDASCGWNLMSLKRCWVNFILPRERNEIWLNAIKTVKVCGWRRFVVHTPQYTFSTMKFGGEKKRGCNEMTEIQEVNWVSIFELPELIGCPLKQKGNSSTGIIQLHVVKLKVYFLHCFHSCIHFYLSSFTICHPTMVPFRSLSMLNGGWEG